VNSQSTSGKAVASSSACPNRVKTAMFLSGTLRVKSVTVVFGAATGRVIPSQSVKRSKFLEVIGGVTQFGAFV